MGLSNTERRAAEKSAGRVDEEADPSALLKGASVAPPRSGLARMPYTARSKVPFALRQSLAVATQCRAEGVGLERAIARQTTSFTIEACDAAGEKLNCGPRSSNVEPTAHMLSSPRFEPCCGKAAATTLRWTSAGRALCALECSTTPMARIHAASARPPLASTL